ncbi:MAG: hypothetical protein IJJ15_08770 [Ruminococcus sp.]|nr:hypothetical protein [Ruminococcus sp.]
MTLTKPTQTLIETIEAIPEIRDKVSMVVQQDDKTGNEYIVLWTKKGTDEDEAARKKVTATIQER